MLRRLLARTPLQDVSAKHRATISSVMTAFAVQLLSLASGMAAARMLGPEDRGYLALLMLVPVILTQLGGLSNPFRRQFLAD